MAYPFNTYNCWPKSRNTYKEVHVRVKNEDEQTYTDIYPSAKNKNKQLGPSGI